MFASDFPDKRSYERERKRRYRAQTGGNTRTAMQPFVGIDGEGGNLDSGHEYLLLRAGDRVLNTGRPLQYLECLKFIADLEPSNCYVGYYFTYDVTMILRSAPEERVRRLYDRKAREGLHGQCFPVDIGPYEIDYLPGKEFKVRHKGTKPWVIISDVGSFFQCSFVKALKSWDIGTPEQMAQIEAGKNERADFGALTADTDKYNALEIDLLEQLMTAFRDVCIDVGYVPRKWQGPGVMASSVFSRHGIKKRKDNNISSKHNLMVFANNAYYGGRFEVTRNGLYAKPVYQYDICSAYPSAMLELPCLDHGEWLHTNLPGYKHALHYGRFTATSQSSLYAFPIRTPGGSIYYPEDGEGWYWQYEIDAARHQNFEPLESWTYVPQCDCQPFSFVQDLYQQRLALGKSARGVVLKLCLNSLYGKLAQSIGAAPYANPIWAGIITSITRAKLLDLICEGHDYGQPCTNDTLMLATDGVFTTAPRRPQIGKALGLWEEDVHDKGLLIVQPGLYFINKGGFAKTRGLPLRSAEANRRQFYTKGLFKDPVSIPLHAFIGLRQALHRNSYELAGQWQDVPREITWNLATKRDPEREWAPYRDGGITVPYSRSIGRVIDELRIKYGEQPDYVDMGAGDINGD